MCIIASACRSMSALRGTLESFEQLEWCAGERNPQQIIQVGEERGKERAAKNVHHMPHCRYSQESDRSAEKSACAT